MNRRDLLKGCAAAAVAGLMLRGDLTPEAAKKTTIRRRPVNADQYAGFACTIASDVEGWEFDSGRWVRTS